MSKAVTERFVKSFLDLFVLDLLDDGPKHGYEIMRELKNKTGARIGAGTLYPLLYELEERKLVAGEWNSPNRRSRRIYKITEPGTSGRMEFSKPAKQKDLQDYRAGHQTQEARLQEHRNPRPTLKPRLWIVTGRFPVIVWCQRGDRSL